MKPDGKQYRRNFADRSEALQRMADMELAHAGKPDSRQSLKTLFSHEQLADAEAAFQQLDGARLSPLVAHYLNLRTRAREKGTDLDQAMSFFETRYRPETKTITIMNAKDEFLASRQDISEATRANYEIGLRLLLMRDPNKYVHAFTVSDIEASLKRYTNLSSLRTFRRIFSVFFHWAVRHHYCLEDPCKRLDKLPKDTSQIATLTLTEVKRLLYAAMSLQDGVAAAAVAIGIFAGLRPSEINDLRKEDVGDEKIRVTGGKLRRTIKRSPPVPPVLAEWLKRYPFAGLPKGLTYKMKALKKATDASKWVADIIRHTSISFQTERDKNEALTAYHCGTSIQMMNRHYRNMIDDDKTIAEFWNLTPEKLLETKPEITLPERKKAAWPEKSALVKLVWEKPLMHVAADIGVSGVALKKHCVKLGIELPAQGYWLRERRDRGAVSPV